MKASLQDAFGNALHVLKGKLPQVLQKGAASELCAATFMPCPALQMCCTELHCICAALQLQEQCAALHCICAALHLCCTASESVLPEVSSNNSNSNSNYNSSLSFSLFQ